MKYIASLSLFLLGVNAAEDKAEAASRVLRGPGGGGMGRPGMGEGGMGRPGMGGHGGMGGGRRNHTGGNRTEMLIELCTNNSIVCADVGEDVLANCTRPDRPGWDRDLLAFVEEIKDDIPSTNLLRGADGKRDLQMMGPRGGGGGHGEGAAGGRWGNLTDAELEEMRLKRLTCKCCKDDDESN